MREKVKWLENRKDFHPRAVLLSQRKLVMTNFPPEYIQRLDPGEAARLRAALHGDREEFGALTEPYRHELQVHCYRILGSWHEAEDLVQETYLRAWRRLNTYEGRASLRSWLYKIATNACLDELDKWRTRRYLPSSFQSASDPSSPIISPTTEPIWLEPAHDDWLLSAITGPETRYLARESISLAFLAALQTLPSRQRSIFILMDVLDWSASEVADLLDTTVSAAHSALHRARVKMVEQYHGREIDNMVQADERTRRMLDKYVKAWETADIAGLVALLKENATLLMPPSPSWYQGRTAVGAFVAVSVFGEAGMFPGKAAGRWKLLPTQANGQPAFAFYQRTNENEYQAAGVQVVTIEDRQIGEVISFNDPSLPARFGLPSIIYG